MKRLILSGSHGYSLMARDPDKITFSFVFNFTWGKLPSPEALSSHLATGSDQHGRGEHWSDYAGRWPISVRRDISLVEFCEPFEEIELWFDPSPSEQLLLIWLLDFLRSYPDVVSRLRLRVVDFDVGGDTQMFFHNWKGPLVTVTERELETASRSWQAYRQPTPEACFDLLSRDLSALPLLRPALVDLLEELPGASGLGMTELRMLELVARGYQLTNALFHLRSLRRTYIFGEIENGYLVEGLAHGPVPVLAGLDDEVRILSREDVRNRHAAYLRSRLSITDFGRAVLRDEEDFSRYNPVDRWWGGTHLTNDNMWRWRPTLVKG